MQLREGTEPMAWRRLIVPAFAALTTLGTAGLAFAQAKPEGYIAAPYVGEMGLQKAMTPGMEKLVQLHDWLLVLITIICLFVLALLGYVMWRFQASKNPVPTQTTHHTGLEIAWTVIPILILVLVAIPSFRLLYYTDKIEDAELTVKITGRQWYWNYEYPDFKNGKGEVIALDSRMIPDKDIDKAKGQIRLLSVDNEMVVPANTKVRIIMTSDDVMHGWAVPSFGMKRTLVPGRLNESWFSVNQEGLFYGQCSQICGQNHSYMPIAVRAVSKDDFKKWMDGKRATASIGAPSTDVAEVPAGR